MQLELFEDCYIDSKGSKMTLTEETSKQIEMCDIPSKDKCKLFYHLKWKGSVYVPEEYIRTSKTVNSVAVVRVKAESKIVIIKQFIDVTNKNLVLVIANKLLRKQNPSVLQKYRCSQLVQVESQR